MLEIVRELRSGENKDLRLTAVKFRWNRRMSSCSLDRNPNIKVSLLSKSRKSNIAPSKSLLPSPASSTINAIESFPFLSAPQDAWIYIPRSMVSTDLFVKAKSGKNSPLSKASRIPITTFLQSVAPRPQINLPS